MIKKTKVSTPKRVYDNPDNYHSDLYNFLIKLKRVYGEKATIVFHFSSDTDRFCAEDAIFHVVVPLEPGSVLRENYFIHANMFSHENDERIAMKWRNLEAFMDEINWRVDEWIAHQEKVTRAKEILGKLSREDVDLVYRYVNGTL